MRFTKFLTTVAAIAVCSTAVAGPTCTKEPKDKWMTEEAFKKQVTDAGFTIAKFKVTKGNCYEIYGTNKEGKKVEIYSDPVSGKAVESK